MNAVVLAAGRGTRLGDITRETPKPLLRVGGRPIIVRILDGLREAGIRDVTIVTGHLAELIEAELGNGSHVGMNLRYVRQLQPCGTSRAVALAREHLGDEPFFFAWGDILVEPSNYRRTVAAARLTNAALAVNHVDEPSAGAAVYLSDGEAPMVTQLVEKPAPGTSATPWNNAGFGVLPPPIWPYIERVRAEPSGEYVLPVAIADFVARGGAVRAVPVEGPWFDVGTPDTLAAARAHYGGQA